MAGSKASYKSSCKYAEKLRQQLEECSLDGVSCEYCSNENSCRELYDMLPIIIRKRDYKRYFKGFTGLRKTKQAVEKHALCEISFSRKAAMNQNCGLSSQTSKGVLVPLCKGDK